MLQTNELPSTSVSSKFKVCVICPLNFKPRQQANRSHSVVTVKWSQMQSTIERPNVSAVAVDLILRQRSSNSRRRTTTTSDSLLRSSASTSSRLGPRRPHVCRRRPTATRSPLECLLRRKPAACRSLSTRVDWSRRAPSAMPSAGRGDEGTSRGTCDSSYNRRRS